MPWSMMKNASIAVCAAKRVRRSICRTCIPPIPIHISGKLTTSLWGDVPTSSCLSMRRVAGHARQRFPTCSEPAKLMPRLCGWDGGGESPVVSARLITGIEGLKVTQKIMLYAGGYVIDIESREGI